MKKSVIALTLLSSGVVSAYENKKFSDQEMVLKAIEMMCKDVWCEGTTDYFFKRVSFDRQNDTTSLFFEIRPSGYPFIVQDNEIFSSSLEQKKFRVRCEIKNYSNAARILDPDGSLGEKFYERLSDCIDSVDGMIGAII
jgi:hypothetical protein